MSQDNKLKEYMRGNFPWQGFKNAIFKGLKFNDYEGKAKRVCEFFSLESVYEYSNIGRGVFAHVTYAHPHAFQRFVEPIGEPLMKVEGKVAKVVQFTNLKK